MAVRSNLAFDGKGYVSGIGASKYWGVNKMTKGSVQKWRVLVHPGNAHVDPNDTNFHAYAKGWNMTEEEAAWIASTFYETPAMGHNFVRRVPSKCGKYQYRINSNREIHRFEREFSDMFENYVAYNPHIVTVKGRPKVVKGYSNKTYSEDVATEARLASMATKLDPNNTEEMEFIKQMTGMILDKRGTPEFYNLMKNLTEIGAEYV